MPLAEVHPAHERAVRHDADARAGMTPRARPPGPPCARCGAPVASRRGARYCSARCRQAAVRERRAVARADLIVALDQLAQATERIERDLRVMGLRPIRPRGRRPR